MLIPSKTLINPELADMTREDLNQRYAHSFVLYKGVPSFIYEFFAPGIFIYKPRNSGEYIQEEFDYKLLNVARPPSQWYCAKGAFFYLSYILAKQWVRGLKPENIHLFFPNRNQQAKVGTCLIETLNPIETITKQYTKLTDPNATEVLMTPRWFFKTPWIYFRAVPVAFVEVEDKFIYVRKESIIQDLREVIDLPHFTIKLETNKQVTYKQNVEFGLERDTAVFLPRPPKPGFNFHKGGVLKMKPPGGVWIDGQPVNRA
jgi:hypothetical protein